MKEKFSASSYWKDCVKYKATTAQYIGEICRYVNKWALRSSSCLDNHRILLEFFYSFQIMNIYVDLNLLKNGSHTLMPPPVMV